MATERDADLDKLNRGRLAAVAWDLVDEEIARLSVLVETRVFGQIKDGTLSPELALAAWHEKKAYKDLRARLERQERIGQGAGRRLEPEMNGVKDNG